MLQNHATNWQRRHGQSREVFSVAARDGIFATGGHDKRAVLSSVEPAATLATHSHTNWVRAVAICPNSNQFVSACEHGVVRSSTRGAGGVWTAGAGTTTAPVRIRIVCSRGFHPFF